VRDSAIGILATGPFAAQQALLWRQWSDDVTLFPHTAPEPGDTAREELAARGIEVVEGEVTGLEGPDDELAGVRLADGRLVPCRALVVAPRFTARVEFLAGLGLTTTEQAMQGHVLGSRIEADASGATEVPGVWVAGNVTSLVEQVIGAAAAGVRAGAAINADLIAEETREAVAARRAASHEEAASQDFWNARYAENEHVWSGAANAALVEGVEDLPAGRALDLGCGEGGDAVWLAGRGWRVTAVDISPIALGRAEQHAADAGVGDLVDWQQHDLVKSFPEGEYDLVSAQYLHLRGATMPREDILRAAASAVAPGGVLLVAGHAALPQSQDQGGHAELDLPTPAEVLSSLRLPEGEWEVLRSEERERVHTAHDGTSASRTDNIVLVRRSGP
jgi:2-polyprenyl-3-methyl-5-hydroxy-6-metoxy-1,4-benzoquinol methylase